MRAMSVEQTIFTPFPARGFPPDTPSSTRPTAQIWPQFNHYAWDNNERRPTQNTSFNTHCAIVEYRHCTIIVNNGKKHMVLASIVGENPRAVELGCREGSKNGPIPIIRIFQEVNNLLINNY